MEQCLGRTSNKWAIVRQLWISCIIHFLWRGDDSGDDWDDRGEVKDRSPTTRRGLMAENILNRTQVRVSSMLKWLKHQSGANQSSTRRKFLTTGNCLITTVRQDAPMNNRIRLLQERRDFLRVHISLVRINFAEAILAVHEYPR
jgi:hypothetical protein